MDVWQLADEGACAGDPPHAIAAVFLYQQLVEEILHLIDYWCFFEQAIGIYPTPFEYAAPERMMFGQLIDRVRQRQQFPRKHDLLQSAQKLNSECRIPAAHKLLHRGTLPRIETVALEAKEHFGLIMDCLGEIRDHFRARFDTLAERTGIATHART